MADKKPADKKPKAIVDVARPGTSAPATSGKSVIVTNRPMLKDPMVVDETPVAPDPDKAKTDSTAVNVRINSKASPQTASLEESAATEQGTAPELPSIEVKTDGTVGPAKAESAPALKKPEIKPPSKKEPDDKPVVKAEEKPAKAEPATDDTAEADEAPVPVPDQAEQEAVAAAEAEHDASVQKLIDNKQYVLQINSVEKRKTKRFVILGIVLSILLALTWVDIALDANLIHISGVKPVTHFFSN